MKKAIIAGAGPAGLTAAKELLSRSNIHPVVFEASGDIGGISKTVRHNGNRIDIGGHRFFSKNKRVMDWWLSTLPLQTSPARDEIILGERMIIGQLATTPSSVASTDTPATTPSSAAATDTPASTPPSVASTDPEQADRVMLARRRVSRIYYLRKFFDYPISLSWSTLRNMGFWRTLKSGVSYLKSIVAKRPENSLEDFYINRFGKDLYSTFFEDYTTKVWGVHPSRLGADWGAQRVKGLSIIGILKDVVMKKFRKRNASEVETSLIEEFLYPKYGPGQMWETVAADVVSSGGEIIMNAPVCEVNVEGGKVKSVTVRKPDSNLREHECDYFLSSMPIKDLVGALRGIEVTADVAEAAANLPYRDFITVGLLVDRLKIKNETKLRTIAGRVPDTWIYVQEKNVKLGRIQVFNNWSPYMVKDFENKVWIGLEYFCTEGDEMWCAPDEEFISKAAGELVEIGILDPGTHIDDAVRIRVKKAYPAYYGSYAQINKIRQFLDGIENLYCIGRNGQHRYNNMDHSMLTSIEAVTHMLNPTPDKEAIWNVNTEKDYHETK